MLALRLAQRTSHAPRQAGPYMCMPNIGSYTQRHTPVLTHLSAVRPLGLLIYIAVSCYWRVLWIT
jgi:hypothetical protein